MTELREALADVDFRRELRAWLTRVFPERWRDPFLRLRGADARWWLRTQLEGGWRAPSWPREHGGLGLSVAKQIIYQQEMERHGVARTLDHGGRMVGPILMRYGSPQQQAAYLPSILNGEHQWCQGYSEPGAGSDLANLNTTATAAGDAFVLNGRKIWTTQAADATHMYVLARTSSAGKKQEGITLLLVSMTTPGITLRPIRNLGDEEEFYEVILDAVAVPRANVVGPVDDGWRIAKALLGFERFSQGSPSLARHAFRLTRRIAADLGLGDDARYQERLARLACDLQDATALFEDLCSAVEAGQDPQDRYSMAKLVSAELFQRITECTVEMAAEGSVRLGSELRVAAERLFILSRPVTIFGGTSEVQRNILAKSLLQ